MIWNMAVVRKIPFRLDGISHKTMCTPKEFVELKLHLLSKSFDQIINAADRRAELYPALVRKNNLFAQYFAM